ncbi:low-specificity L-threonine aldolase [Paludibacterium paludis]|uniref:Threonine aldolase n=1 Tax=Paludibacterium paludis TaxID=1225769 RepID=A0A918U8Z2_9NEIS|nr:low-specificity L-threonine aldolase [Paludibacterium paludis]GGY09484.1 threonine aldolase [Paludibacterium paludis]
MQSWIDVRSDTVTRPTERMREAMLRAEVGDDVYGDDPEVNALEREAAERLGKEAALFVPTGTMGNQLALMTHCRRGDEVILGDDCHIVWHETGGAAVLAGVQLRTVESRLGVLDAEAIRRRIRTGDDIHCPRTTLICLENAHSNGRVIPLAAMREVAELARGHGVPVHLDGARIFNAASRLKVEAAAIAAEADSVMFCLSKGLCAPAGSLLAGRRDFIERARRHRKLLGGGMRQAGVLAAPGRLALSVMSRRLDEDHENARWLAGRLAQLPGFEVDPAAVDINMVWFGVPASLDTARLMAALETAGIKANPPENRRMRIVTHHDVDRAGLETLLGALRSVL